MPSSKSIVVPHVAFLIGCHCATTWRNPLHSQLSSPTSSQLSIWHRSCHSMPQPQWKTASGDDKEVTFMDPSWLCHASTLRWILPFLAGKVIWPHNGCELWSPQIDAFGARHCSACRWITNSLLLRHVYSDYFRHCSLASRSSWFDLFECGLRFGSTQGPMIWFGRKAANFSWPVASRASPFGCFGCLKGGVSLFTSASEISKVICAALYYWFETDNPDMIYCPALVSDVSCIWQVLLVCRFELCLFFVSGWWVQERWCLLESLPFNSGCHVRCSVSFGQFHLAIGPDWPPNGSHNRTGTTPFWTFSESSHWQINTPWVVALLVASSRFISSISTTINHPFLRGLYWQVMGAAVMAIPAGALGNAFSEVVEKELNEDWSKVKQGNQSFGAIYNDLSRGHPKR